MLQKFKLSSRLAKIKHTFLSACLTMLTVLTLAFLFCPILFSETHAEASLSRSATTDVSVAVTDLNALELHPDLNQGFSTSTSQLTISTTSPDGFSILLSSQDNNLTSTNVSDTTNSIKSLSAASISSEFDDNTWGYYLGTHSPDDETVYQPIPTTATTIFNTDKPTTAQNYQLTFGAKVDASLAAGIYNTNLLVSVVANPSKLGALGQITYLQEMTPEICENTADYVDKDHYATKQLIDNRDNKKYWVAKLADGNCWMTQNLALDIDSNNYKTQLTSSNTDIPANYSWPYAMNPTVGYNYQYGNPSADFTNSWNYGNYTISNPFSNAQCGSDTPSLPANCTNLGMTLIDESWKDDFVIQKVSDVGGVDTYTTVDYDTKRYDAHYLIGNFYTYNAATAGAGGIRGGDWIDSASICAKGWHLPRDRLGWNNSFSDLFEAYGFTPNIGGSDGLSSDNADGYNLYKPPVSFVRAGLVNMRSGGYGYGIESAYYWTNYVTNGSSELAGYFQTSSTISRGDNSRWLGYSVRCLAR